MKSLCFASGSAGAAEIPHGDHEPALKVVSERIRALLFYTITFLSAVPLFATMLLAIVPECVRKPTVRPFMHSVNRFWAALSRSLFFAVRVHEVNNLPPKGDPVVYVANHCSYLDIFSLLALPMPFRFISKRSVFFFPVIGWAMFLTGHISLARDDTRSQMRVLEACRSAVRHACPVLFFPEGTRSSDGSVGTFKRGAFTVAAKENAKVVPISIHGTHQLMPRGKELRLRSGTDVHLHVHEPLDGAVLSAQELCRKSEEAITNATR